jgi:type IV secretion system protein VirB9
MKKIALILLAVFLFLPVKSFAVQVPRVIGSEKRFRVYVYNPNDVYKYMGYYMYQSYIEFDEDEKVQTISMGDSTAWQMVTLGNKLFLKPIASYPETNMTLLTNKRTYHFELDATEAENVQKDEILFYVKFMYPDENDKTIVSFKTTKNRDDYPDMADLTKYNFNYEFSGSSKIAPIKVFDDGEFTYMEFPDENAEIPAIFVVNSSGYEALVNFRVVDNYIVIERVDYQFTLRSGNDIVCIYNNSMRGFK